MAKNPMAKMDPKKGKEKSGNPFAKGAAKPGKPAKGGDKMMNGKAPPFMKKGARGK